MKEKGYQKRCNTMKKGGGAIKENHCRIYEQFF